MNADDDAPESPEELAKLRDAADAAWSAFRQTPAWAALRLSFERQRRQNIRQAGQMGLSDGDRAVLSGMNWVLEQFLSSPDQALQRLRMNVTNADRTGDE